MTVDIDYIQKDFNSAVDAMIAFATVNYGPGTTANRQWTNFNEESFSRNWLEIVAFMADVLFFYFDVQATQSYLQSATLRSAVRDIAKQFGFTPATTTSASGDGIFTITGNGTVPRGFKVASVGGVEFFVTTNTVVTPGEATIPVLQGAVKTEQFSSTGLQNEEFDLAGPNVIVDSDNLNTPDITPQVTVAGNSYTLVDSLIRFTGEDTPVVFDALGEAVSGGRVFLLDERADGTPFISFGDGIFGRKLQPGETITITYRTGGGSEGNIAKETLTTLVDTLSFVSAVNNTGDFSGGADEQSIEQLRELIPTSLRTLKRAVAEQDYSDIIIANFSEVFTASAEVNNEDVGIDLNIYVVPQGTGIANITDNTILLNKISNFIDIRKTVTVQFQILDAFGVDTLISLEVFISDTASKSVIEQTIQTALLNYFDLDIGGSDESGISFAEHILLKDISIVLNEINGIKRFEIKKLTYRPRIAQNLQGLSATYNTSDVTIFSNISESEWLIGASGTDAEAAGTVLFNNDSSIGYSFDETTGKITYDSTVNLEGVAPGDSFRNGNARAESTEIQCVGDGAGTEEVTVIQCLADQQGISEVTEITAVADNAGSLGGTYFIMYDSAGSVGVWINVDSGDTQPSTGANRHIEVSISANDIADAVATAVRTALNADPEFTAPAPAADTVTVTNATKKDVFDTEDGNIPTGFTFNTVVEGADSDKLQNTYFLINSANDTTEYYIWYDAGLGTDPSLAGKTGVSVTISPNDSAEDVATATKTALDGVAGTPFVTTRVVSELTIENVTVGVTTDASDGAVPTGFVISTATEGADAVSLGGKYFIIYDESDKVVVWIDVDNGNVQPTVAGTPRYIEVDITAADLENDVASAIATELNNDSKFTAFSTNNVVSVDTVATTSVSDAEDVDTGFTINVITQGVGADAEYTILGIDISSNSIYVAPNSVVNSIGAGPAAGGSIRNEATTFESFKCFKKINGTATNLSINSITDVNLDFTIVKGTATALEARILLDNTQTFKKSEYSTGEYYLVDGLGNIWDILDNTNNTIYTSITAINDASVTTVGAGDYEIVKKLTGKEIVFNNSFKTIEYNNKNTIFVVGGQFIQIGTIGDNFQISETQTNIGRLGVAVEPISYVEPTGEIRLNGSPDLSGLSSEDVLLDNSGQILKIIGVDNRSLPSVFYSFSNKSAELILTGTGSDSRYAQGFQVAENDTYASVSFWLERQGNIVGNLTAAILNDDGTGKPDIASPVAISNSLSVSSVDDTAFEKVTFSFTTPPELISGTQYHLSIFGDTSYQASQQDNVTTFNNSGPVTYSYTIGTGIIEYDSDVDLSNVSPGNFFEDDVGDLYQIEAVDNSSDQVQVAAGSSVQTGANGNILAKDNILLAADNTSTNFSSGELQSYDGASWTAFGTTHDAIFAVEGPKIIKIDSNLIPSLGSGATISRRYYDDDEEISVIIGLSAGIITSATNVNAIGKGTVATVPNTNVDNFIFRTSRFSDDIVNLRQMEIPQLTEDDINITIFGGVE